ncbi:MAG: signal recognition particle protein [Ignavibacteria bacterium RIFOXYB2_FULL_35_12]|nr:MAG: signal recognition particle protein [Ignavibacteria bacterium GWA2_36_19]OGU61455.1 MAG: signal recognition particle protein [Ignavibacteria bacterium GWF2_35_20]OGU81514.1 MAG: signal recognition particle protein [Ignavibacteria bacterium RIFOXYA2_FULL_35_9]OGU85488.1 MAG: signal recognition particle protein [Ignavibacteria bacterium RIFOXYA12_FULL_35_25]OGU90256.1 MAG: signal recognition particle protein [Ignavibacteria bacterium RIFOXYC12_FULL_35_11]OGU96692.1 MAG: signal recognitio
MFEDLALKLESALKKVRGQGKLTENNISDTLREIRRILLDADVNFKVAKDFIEDVKTKALGKEVLSSITPGQLITKIIYDELVHVLGGNQSEIKINGSGITTILISGLQGSGKTTFSAKLAKKLKDNQRRSLLVAADIQRPAAVKQLQMLGEQINIPVFSLEEKDALKVVKNSIEHANENNFNTVIIDTAGRLHVDEDMMAEIEHIKNYVLPTETLFVVDAMTGQDAVNSARIFNERLNFDGIVLTKLDGDARGGAALSIRSIVGKPIKFISNGEKLNQLETFYPERLASRILGKGDVISLVEKVQENFEEIEADRLEEKIRKNEFDFEDFLKQIKAIKKMGSLSSLVGMLPGLGSQVKNMKVDDNALVKTEAIINSMTYQERKKPKILNGNRRMRIARGSGTSIQEVNRLLKQFSEMQKMMSQFSKKGFGGPMLKNYKFN